MATHITNATQLQNMNLNLTENYILDNDIDLTGVIWTPIGSVSPFFFSGSLDGQGFTIRNLTINNPSGLGGLFDTLGDDSPEVFATISNLKLENFNFTVNTFSGALAGRTIRATLNNIYVNDFEIIPSDDSPSYLGGLVGYMAGGSTNHTTLNGYYAENITLGGDEFIGGIAGYSQYLDYQKCSVNNLLITISGDDRYAIAGLIGDCNFSTGIDCYVNGDINDGGVSIGGLIGNLSSSELKNSYSNIAMTSSATEKDLIGGICGFIDTDSLLRNCYSVGIISMTGNFIGGAIGQINGTPTINNIAWFTDSFTYAIGKYPTGTNAMLQALGYGTDEPDNTQFQNDVHHAVYAQGTANQWDFERTQS
jgi:hypothetical protein